MSLRSRLDSMRFWTFLAYIIVVLAITQAVYAQRVYVNEARKSRSQLCAAVNETRSVMRRIILEGRDEVQGRGLMDETVQAYYTRILAYTNPVDCSEIAPRVTH